ncbi:MAG: AMP-binding protein, partial [Phycisphaerales bacterium]
MGLIRTIRNQLLLHPRRIAVVDDQREWRSFELLALSWHLAREIAAATRRPRVGVMLPTSGLFPAAALAAWTAGRTLVPLNYLLNPEELAFVIEDAELDAVVTIGPMVDLVGGLPAGVRQLRLDEMRDRLRGLPAPRRLRGVASRDPAVILCTSGTSSRPKGVMLAERNLQA